VNAANKPEENRLASADILEENDSSSSVTNSPHALKATNCDKTLK